MATTKVDFYASHTHYLEHLAPIYLALPAANRGDFLAGAGSPAADRARLDYDIKTIAPSQSRHRTRAVVVASYGDLKSIDRAPVIFLEHGAGQTYGTRHPSGPGGTGRDHVALYLTPNAAVAAANTVGYPNTPNAIVGIPKLDPWHTNPPTPWHHEPPPRRPPIVAVSFTWDRPQAAEARSAYPHYRRYLHRLARRYPGAIATGHPRSFPRLIADYRRYGFELTARFADILDVADVYVCDNSSTIYEFASTDRPVVVLNAPWYRRDVDHGLRFWAASDVGINVDHPAQLNDAVARALEDPPETAARRRRITSTVYAHIDGHAAKRAAEAIMALITSRTTKGRCKVCGADHAGCTGTTTGPDGNPVDTVIEQEASMQPANYRVKRYVNGHLAEIAVTADELTDDEKVAHGLSKPKRSKNRGAKNKARTPDNTPNKSANKDVWVAHAEGLGIPVVDDAGEPLNKKQVIAAVEAATA